MKRDNNFANINIDLELQEQPERRRKMDNDVRNSRLSEFGRTIDYLVFVRPRCITSGRSSHE